MHPILFKIGPITIHSFGVMAAIGFAAAILWTYRQSRRAGLNADVMLNLTFWLMLSGLAGSRLLFVLTNLSDYASAPLDIFKLWQGGIVWYGGLLAAIPVAYFYTRAKKIPQWKAFDILSPAAMLGLAFGRIGCLLAGDDHGKVVESGKHWWTLTFSDPYALVAEHLLGKPLYPTQILMSLNAFFLFGILETIRRRQKFDGQTFCCLLIFYSVTRYLIEILRGDEVRGFLIYPYVSTSQFIGILTFVAGILLYRKRLTHRTL